MADGYISQIKTPDNKVYDFRDQHLKVYTGSCTTAAGTAIKDVTTDGEFTLAKGAVIFVNFSATNTAAVADLKLRVNSSADDDAKPIKHQYNASESNLPGTGYIRANQTYMFYYDGTHWVIITDYNTDGNDAAGYIREFQNGAYVKPTTILYRYQLLLPVGDGEHVIPVNTTSNSTATNKTTITTDEFDIRGHIEYYNATSTIQAEGNLDGRYHWMMRSDVNLGYSFNTGSTLTPYENVYIVATLASPTTAILRNPEATGSNASAQATGADAGPITQTLPTTEDGYIYIKLGRAYSATNIILTLDHPVYWYKDGEIRLYTEGRGLKSITRSGTTFTATRDDGSTFTFTQQDTNKYHKTGSWGGTNNLTYTATAVNSADALAFTLATASTNAYGATKLSSATDSDSEVLAATPKAIKTLNTKMDGLLAAADAMIFKGTLGTGGTVTALPATHNAGWTYRVITAGTWAGKYCEVGTLIICVKDGTAAADADWTSVETNEDGAVIGPSSSIANQVPKFSSNTGRVITSSEVKIDDNNNITTTGSYLETAAGRFQQIDLLPGGSWSNYTDDAWYRCCKITPKYGGYVNFIIQFGGSWSTGAPTIATVSIQTLNTTITLLHCSRAGFIKAIRLVNNNGMWLDVQLYAAYSSGAMGKPSATFIGNVVISDISTVATITTDTTAPAATLIFRTTTDQPTFTLQDNDGTNSTTSTFTHADQTLKLPATIKANVTGNVTGNCSGSSGSCTGNAATASELKGTAEAAPALTTAPSTGNIRYSYNVNTGTTGLFSSVDNSNSIITLNKHNGNYNSQLGFSSNGNIYYRNFDGNALNNTKTWEQLAFISSTVAGAKVAKHASAAHWSTTSGSPTGVLKVKIKKKQGWMLAFTIRVYQAYTYDDYIISGYNYGSSKWYSPEATILGSESTSKHTVTFGYDDDADSSGYRTLWVSIPIRQYTGIDIFNITNGYSQIEDMSDAFEIIHETESTGTVQTTVDCYRPWYRNETVSAAETATNLSAKPVFASSGDNITVTAGGKTSDAFTVPYATSAGSATTATQLSFKNGRIASADLDISTMHSKMLLTLASSSMTTSKPPMGDGYIVTYGWDNAYWGAQQAISHSKTPHMAIRGTNGSSTNDWGDWIYLLDANNYSSYALPLSGGQMTGPLTWKNGDALPEKTSADYFLAIDAFSNGGKTYWISKANVLSSIGAAPAVTGGYLPLSGGKMTGRIYREGVSTSWGKGRASALVATSTINGYSPFASIKTSNGSWDIGAYNNASYTDDLVFSYVTDTQYSGNSGTTAQIKFLENGHIVGALDGNATTATSATSATNASKISAKLATTTKTYLLGTSTTITGTAANVEMTGDTGVYLTTTAGQLNATTYLVNEKVRMEYNSTDQSLDFIFI